MYLFKTIGFYTLWTHGNINLMFTMYDKFKTTYKYNKSQIVRSMTIIYITIIILDIILLGSLTLPNCTIK